MKRIKLLAGVVLFALPIVLSLAAPSTARQKYSGSTTTIDGLKEAGYSCARVSLNFIECTKPGEPTFWCTDNGSCQKAPMITTPVKPPSQLPETRPGDVFGTQDPPSWGTSIPELKDRVRF